LQIPDCVNDPETDPESELHPDPDPEPDPDSDPDLVLQLHVFPHFSVCDGSGGLVVATPSGPLNDEQGWQDMARLEPSEQVQYFGRRIGWRGFRRHAAST
jgi:hypothetical protein